MMRSTSLEFPTDRMSDDDLFSFLYDFFSHRILLNSIPGRWFAFSLCISLRNSSCEVVSVLYAQSGTSAISTINSGVIGRTPTLACCHGSSFWSWFSPSSVETWMRMSPLGNVAASMMSFRPVLSFRACRSVFLSLLLRLSSVLLSRTRKVICFGVDCCTLGAAIACARPARTAA